MSEGRGARFRWMVVAAALCAMLMVPRAWNASRGWVFPDGTSYFDIASQAAHGSPAVLLRNAYWSPGYPAVLALMMAVAHPSLAAELSAIYFVHWLLFVAAAVCFTVFFRTFLGWLEANSWTEPGNGGVVFKALVCFGYSFFLVLNLNQTLWYATPDMLLQSMVYLSAAGALRLFLPGASWRHSAALGLILGAGYLAKAAMFPAALLLLAVLFLKPPKDGLGRRHVACALACFCVAAAPLVLSLSHEKHRFTFGDSGKLNYAWFVGGVPHYGGWTGQSPENGTPAHAPRKVSERPLILEFRTPVAGTLPIWYDPSYWWEGLRTPFDARRQLAPLVWLFTHPHSRQTLMVALIAVLLPFCLISGRVRRGIGEGGARNWILLLWPVAVCAMYSMVNICYRYTAVYLVIFGMGAASLLLQPLQPVLRARVLFTATVLLFVGGAVQIRPLVQAMLRGSEGTWALDEHGDTGLESAAIARELAQLGIRPGDEISVLGNGLDCYYARLAQVRIVAQIWEDPDTVEGMSGPEVRRALSQLKQIGVKALVSRVKPGFRNDEGWVAVARTNAYVRML